MYADAGEIGPKPRLHVSTHTVRKGTATSFTLIDLSFDIICRLKAFSQSTGGFDLDRFGFFRGTLGLSQRGHLAGFGKKIDLDVLLFVRGVVLTRRLLLWYQAGD